MVAETLRFYKNAPAHAQDKDTEALSLGGYLSQNNYSQTFINDHLLPMGAAIWSMAPQQLLEFPFRTFINFCNNHGLLQLRDRPQWRTVSGGSINYVEKLATAISGKIILNASITQLSESRDPYPSTRVMAKLPPMITWFSRAIQIRHLHLKRQWQCNQCRTGTSSLHSLSAQSGNTSS